MGAALYQKLGSASAEAFKLHEDNVQLRLALRWIADQRWSENADLDDICSRAEAALRDLEK